MPSAPISALLVPGIKATFAMAYQHEYQDMMPIISECIAEVTSDKLYEIYGVIDSAIHPARWDPGRSVPARKLGGTNSLVTNRDFGRRILLARNYDDEQTGQLLNASMLLGQNWGILPERIFFQFVQNGTDPDLLPAVPNSTDGNALYITTTRYGRSGGNGVSQTGSSTTQAIITDLYSAIQTFREFQDTEGQPYWAFSLTQRPTVFYGTSLSLVVEQVATQALTHSVVSSTGAAVSNTAITGTIDWRFVGTQRITNSKLYLFLRGVPLAKRAILRQVRKGMTQFQGNWQTSDYTRETGEIYFQYFSREGWGSISARSTVRIA